MMHTRAHVCCIGILRVQVLEPFHVPVRVDILTYDHCYLFYHPPWKMAYSRGGERNSQLIPQSVAKQLAERSYERRKAAALHVEEVARTLAGKRDTARIQKLIQMLTDDFALCAEGTNQRKGGLIGLAAATVGLGDTAPQHLCKIIPPIIANMEDQEPRVRFYAAESMYNLIRATRDAMVPYFIEDGLFDGLAKLSADSSEDVQNAAHLLDRLLKDVITESTTFNVADFVPVLKDRMRSCPNPYVRQFLISWILVLDSVPDIDMLPNLPDLLEGLLEMLSDDNVEIRQQADAALAEFLQEIKQDLSIDFSSIARILVHKGVRSSNASARMTALAWLHELVHLAENRLLNEPDIIPDILDAVLPCLSHKDERIRELAHKANDELAKLDLTSSRAPVVSLEPIARAVGVHVTSGTYATKLQALEWVAHLHRQRPDEMLGDVYSTISPLLLGAWEDDDDEVILKALEVQASIAHGERRFKQFICELLEKFKSNAQLLHRKGNITLRRLCTNLDPERVFRELARLLTEETDSDFADTMVQVLNLILVTSDEAKVLRMTLRTALSSDKGSSLFTALYDAWCQNAVATLSLCLLSQTYKHALQLAELCGDMDFTADDLLQIDRLVCE